MPKFNDIFRRLTRRGGTPPPPDAAIDAGSSDDDGYDAAAEFPLAGEPVLFEEPDAGPAIAAPTIDGPTIGLDEVDTANLLENLERVDDFRDNDFRDDDFRADDFRAAPPPPPPPQPAIPPLLEPEPEPVLAGAGTAASAGAPAAAAAAPADGGAFPGFERAAAPVIDDDVLYHDHLLLECPYCGRKEQRVGGRCEHCNQVIVRLPTWAQRRRRNWITRRLSVRRMMLACVITLFIVFLVWVNYPFAPDPVVLFRNISSNLSIDSGPGSWSVTGRDLRHSRYIELGPPPPAGQVKWQSFVAEPLAAEPIVQRANIYLGSANGIYPLAIDSGQVREGWEGDTVGLINSAPAIIESYLYFGSTDHTVNAWDAFNADPRWTFKAADTVDVAPVVSGGLVYISSGEGWVYALDAANGNEIWSRQLDSNATAAVAIDQGKLLVGDDKGFVYILSARTGQEWFRYRTPRAITGSPVVSVDGERAYFTGGGQLYAINAREREIPGLYQFKQMWAQLWLWQVPGVPRPSGQQGGLWRFTPDNPLLGLKSSPALAEGILYAGGHDHILYAIDSLSGEPQWTYEAREAIWASPVVVKDQVIFGDDSGTLYSLNRESGVLTWEVDLGDRIRIAPSLVNGTLIVRTVNGNVYAVD